MGRARAGCVLRADVFLCMQQPVVHALPVAVVVRLRAGSVEHNGIFLKQGTMLVAKPLILFS